jgi:YesN/AraC family two-component response regulator
MKNMVFDIQTNETSQYFPFKLFYNHDIFAPDHCHTEVELIYILSNSMDGHINGSNYHLNKGDIVMIANGDIHGISYSNHSRMVIQFKLDVLEGLYTYSDDMNKVLDKMQTLERMSTKWPSNVHQKVSDILMSLKQAEETLTETAYRIRVCSLLYQLIDICFNDIPQSEDQLEKRLITKNKEIFLKVQNIFTYIQDNFNKNITIDEVANSFHFSPNYFTKIWRKYTGTSFHTYLNEYRINRSTFLLKDTDLLVSEIGYETGFQSTKTFNRVFKSIIGVSPSEYRMSFQKNK